ncbi:MAG: NAD-dependent epimerase/dehydratase family protein [Cyanobacteriota bacterium]|nr:NAD-dependent epimerase/dehydratase family protein [Cyanobacteriota bacterium]
MDPHPLLVDTPPTRTVAITGAGGSLGRALLRLWHRRGWRLVALSHRADPLVIANDDGAPIPLDQVRWQVGREAELAPLLERVDLLVINHGINVHGDRDASAVERSLEVNALSVWRLMETFAGAAAAADAAGTPDKRPRPEVWVNTSEAEIQPALSPLYEISKRLVGQLVSLRSLDLGGRKGPLRVRRLVLGPFRSELNPHGPMAADGVAGAILMLADLGLDLIVVTINPLTYLTMPLATLARWLYLRSFSRNPGP